MSAENPKTFGPTPSTDAGNILGIFDMSAFRTAGYTLYCVDPVNSADIEVAASDDGGVTYGAPLDSQTLAPAQVDSTTLQVLESAINRYTHLKVTETSTVPGAPSSVRAVFFGFS